MKRKIIVFTIVLSMLVSSMLVAVGDEATFEGETTVVDWDGEVEETEWSVRHDAGTIRGYKHTFTLDMQSDSVPNDISMEFEGEADMYRRRFIEISRPTHPWQFVRWTGAREAEEEEITVEMDEDKDLMAHFGEEKYQLRQYVPEGEGTVEIDPDQIWYERGEEVELKAVPADPTEDDEVNSEWEFSHWTRDHPEGDQYDEEITVEMDHDKYLYPIFEKADEDKGNETHELTVNIEGDGDGTVDVHGEEVTGESWTQEYQEGTALRLEALEDDSSSFSGWGEYTPTGEETETVFLDEDKEVTANFDDEVTYDIDIIERGKGKVERTDKDLGLREGLRDLEPGTEVTLKATPDDTMVLDETDRGDREGEFDEAVSVANRSNIRENIYDQATSHLREEYGSTRDELPPPNVVNLTEILFTKDNEDWMTADAEPLKGEYELTIMLEGINVEMEEAQVTFEGEDGKEEDGDGIPGFTPPLLLSATVIAVAIYHKKKLGGE